MNYLQSVQVLGCLKMRRASSDCTGNYSRVYITHDVQWFSLLIILSSLGLLMIYMSTVGVGGIGV